MPAVNGTVGKGVLNTVVVLPPAMSSFNMVPTPLSVLSRTAVTPAGRVKLPSVTVKVSFGSNSVSPTILTLWTTLTSELAKVTVLGVPS